MPLFFLPTRTLNRRPRIIALAESCRQREVTFLVVVIVAVVCTTAGVHTVVVGVRVAVLVLAVAAVAGQERLVSNRGRFHRIEIARNQLLLR